MNKLWKYEDYVNHLSHENDLIRRWALSALESRFLNRYTDQVANLINDRNENLVCAALRYLSYHQALQHAPAILKRFKNAQGIVSSNCAVTLAKMYYEPAMEVMLERFSTAESSETFFGVLDYLGNMRTEQSRAALRSAVIQLQDSFLLETAIANLWRHHHPEDINLVMEMYLNSGDDGAGDGMFLRNILSPLGGGTYFRSLIESGNNCILSNPSVAIDNLDLKNSHITIDETLRENVIALIENRQYKDLVSAIMFDARRIIQARYPQDKLPDCLKEIFGQDTMCLHLLEDFWNRGPIWERVEHSSTSGPDLISLIISVYFAIKERSAYVEALHPAAGVEALIQALQNSGPELPVQIQGKIKVLSPIGELKKALSRDLMTWGDIWTVKLMGIIGSKEFVPDLIRVLRNSDSLDYIHDDALQSINALGESADEGILAAIKNGELGDWDVFEILEHLPYAEAYEFALNRWESHSADGMDSYEILSSCLRGIGDRRGIKKLRDIYADENDAGYIGDSLQCLSNIHMVDIPELPDIMKRRKEGEERQKAKAKELTELARNYNRAKKEQGEIESAANVVPFKRKSAKIGRNQPCPCGSGKKYKKCCLNKK